jgi:toxin ParE1/3/4
MARITRAKLARKDLRNIWLNVAQDSVAAADRLVDRIDSVVRMLSQNPRLGERQDDLRPNLRRFVVGSYLVFYQPARGGIRVVRILHGARRWEDEF